ncbi:TetR family transcriptional regulator C-terminal domain-containing protein, partial [Aeromicrobium sp.]
DTTANPLLSLRESMMNALTQAASDEQTRRVFEVATHKVEYVSEMQAVRDRHLQVRNQCISMTQEILQQAVQREGIALSMPVATAALGLHVIMDGLIQNWLLEPDAFDLVKSGRLIMDGYLQGLGFVVPAERALQRRTGAPPRKLAAV